ncbi:hypothetical protein ANCDUO_06939 [Ancylostoma duodenale]|uniref:C2H2-type domain-containing protein n=1 Tax=Ancylostoma duodenale TaxID=51022 RepID=A0A0C2GUU9_9BILA|nr:hypothetical protein ANCDUO_06939 [Ancylostoma duodenale]
MSDDEGRLLIDDIQDGSGSMDHDFSNSVLVDVKSAQGDAENTSINKLSTPLTVPVFGQPQVTSSGDVHFHGGATSAQRMETSPFPFASNLTKLHGEQEASTTLNSSPAKHKKKLQHDTSPSVFAPRSDNHTFVSTPRSSTSKGRGEGLPPRKRKDSSFDEQNLPESDSDETVTKKPKPQTRDRGTCVHSRAVQCDSDASFFDLEVGSTRLVEMTVVCKMENNELYVNVKWKDQEMSGVLTDGRSPAYNPYMKKRQALMSSGSNSSSNSASGEPIERASNSGASTPSKSRQQPSTNRESKKRTLPSDGKRKLSCSTTRPGSSTEPQDDDDELDVESTAGGSSSHMDAYKLFEVPGRQALMSSGSNSSSNSASGEPIERASNSGASTPSKSRQQPSTPRDSKKRTLPSDGKRKLSCSTTRPGSSTEPQDDDDELDVESTAGGSSSHMDAYKLFEVPGRKSMHICPFEGCQHRYARGEEMEYHKATAHAKRAVMYEAICCQTDISAFRRRTVQTDVEGLAPEEPVCPPTVVEAAVKHENVASASTGTEAKVEDPQPSKSPAGYSDISDDGVAPQLQKEEPTNDVRAPLLISTTLPTSSASGPANILTSPEFAPSPREREAVPESLPSTPQQPKVSRPSSMPVAPATPTALQSSFQPVSVPVTPAPTGMYMSSFAHQMMPPFTPTQLGPTPTANAAPSPQQQSLTKLPQPHVKPADEVAPASGVLSAAKTMQSPAAQSMQRQFGLQMMQSGTESLPSTPQQPKVSRPSSMPVAPATPTALQSSFQPVSAERNRGTVNGTGVSPVVNSVGTPTSVSAISASARYLLFELGTLKEMVHYLYSSTRDSCTDWNVHVFVRSSNDATIHSTQLGPTPSANAAPSPQQQSLTKLPQPHVKPADEVAPASGVLSAAKTMQSPAAQSMQRQFGLQMMQSGTGQHQAAMMQAAAAQAQMAQMHHLYMQQMAAGARGAQFPMAGTSASAHEMAQLVALQALCACDYYFALPELAPRALWEDAIL